MQSLFDIKVNSDNFTQLPQLEGDINIPKTLLRSENWSMANANEFEAVRHFTKLSQHNFSIDTNFYPLGSCTMKYNPKVAHSLAFLESFVDLHPERPDEYSQGILTLLWNLKTSLEEITGMQEVSLTPMAGAQGELAGVEMIKAYHNARKDKERNEIIIPEAAHGTNPASAVMAGFIVKEIPNLANGDIDLDALKLVIGPKTAGIMLTNPSTLGVFDRNIQQVAKLIHDCGGLLYYDGANLNAILGKVRPGDMGFDVMHMNLHKTFATPHGGGGPGSGAVGVGAKLKPYLPIPKLHKHGNVISWIRKDSSSIGRMSGFYGNMGVLIRAYIYIALLGKEGLIRVSEFATLNANYLMARLQQKGLNMAYPDRLASHEFSITLKQQHKLFGVTARDWAKRLLDFNIHAPTTYFPTIIPECLLIEPTETESKDTLDNFITVMGQILDECQSDPNKLKEAPYTTCISRLDETKAVKVLDIADLG